VSTRRSFRERLSSTELAYPVQTLMDYLKVGDRVDDFLDDFPTVSREQIAAVLDVAGEAVTRYARIA
jgi:uncharacterized protein (DUF433 family)